MKLVSFLLFFKRWLKTQDSSIQIPDIVFWFLLAVIFPLSAGLINVLNCLFVLVYIIATFFLGHLCLNKIKVFAEIPSLIKTGLYIILGSFVSGLIYLILPSNSVLYFLVLFFVLWIFINKNFSANLYPVYLVLFLSPLLLMLFQTYELAYSTSIRFNKSDGDFFYYTAIVESLKANHNLGNAVYHQGIGINYQAFALFAPAQLAKFANLPSQIALWGVYCKILPIVTLSVVAYAIIKIYQTLFNVTLSKKQFNIKLFFVSCMLLFFGPLHFLNLFKRDFANTLFLGEGYVLPTGSPGFALSMLFSGLALLIIVTIPKPKWYEKFILICFLCIIVGSKLALFFPLAVLLGAYSLLLASRKEYYWFFTLLFALPFCLIVYKLTLAGSDSIATMQLTKNGYYQEYFADLATKYQITGSAMKKVVLMFGITVFMWLSIKLVFLFSGLFLFKKNNKQAMYLIIATFVSFVISVLPSFFLNVFGSDENGNFLFDGRFDMTQFIRADIFLITIVTIIVVLYLMEIYKNKFINKLTIYICVFWMMIISFSFYNTNLIKAKTPDQSWYLDVQSDFLKIKPNLMAMIGSENYSGQTLVSAGVYPWYCTGLRNDGEGYTMALGAHNRNKQFQQIFDTSRSIEQRKATISTIKNVGVDYIVASPSSINKINTAVSNSLLSKAVGTKWLFKVN